MPHPRRGLALLLSLLAAACAGTPPSGTTPGAERERDFVRSASSQSPFGLGFLSPPPDPSEKLASPTLDAASPSPTPLAIALSTSAPINPATATLFGAVRAPATLLSNNGAGLISDQGMGLVSNNGGSMIGNQGAGYRLMRAAGDRWPMGAGPYRVMQAATGLEQFFVAGARIELLDATGKVLRGADGQPLATLTREDGTFAFTTPMPTRHFIVRATPPGQVGALSRLVAAGQRQAEVDIATALVANYVMDQYVATQADRQATLDKLPAKVEAETVALAASALKAAALPSSLEPAALVSATNALRSANSGFDSQMELVKQILIAAGVSNLGVGLPATAVYFRRIFNVEAAPDGTLYLDCNDDRLIYRITPDGKLGVGAGTGQAPTDAAGSSRNGLKADAFGLGHVWVLQVDDVGRLLVAEDQHGIWRREVDGTVTELHSMAALKTAFGDSFLGRGSFIRGDGTLVTLNDSAIWELPRGGAKKKLADAPGVNAAMGLVELPGRRQWLAKFFERITLVSADEAPRDVFADKDPRLVNQGGVYAYPSLDAFGSVYYHAAADNRIHRLKLDGANDVVLDPATLKYGLSAIRTGLDGKLYVTDCDLGDNLGAGLVRRVTGAAGAIAAGLDGLPRGFTSDGRVPLLYPQGLDVAPDGTLFIADAGALIKIPPGGAATTIAAKGTALPALNDTLTFTGVRRLASGKLVARALGTGRELLVRQTDTGWEPAIVQAENFGNPWNIAMHAWDAAPDGTLVASVHAYPGGGFSYTAKVLQRKPNDTFTTELVPTTSGFGEIAKLGFAPDGTLWMRARLGELGSGVRPARYTVSSTGTPTEIASGMIVAEAKDAAGFLYEGDASTFTLGNYGDRHIRRVKANTTPAILAGPGAALLGGEGLDDSIGWAEDLRFDAAGNLYFRDSVRRQIRRIPRERL